MLPEIPELKLPPGTVRITRHLANNPPEKPGARRGVPGLGEKQRHQLQVRPTARSVKARKKDFFGADGSGSASVKPRERAASPSENPKRNRRRAEAPRLDKDIETGLEEAFPSAGDLQAWFKDFTSERFSSEATNAQSQSLEPPKVRVNETYKHDKVESGDGLRRFEETGVSGPIKTDPRRGNVFREPKEELDTLASSVDIPEKQAVEQSNVDGGPAIVVLNSASRSLLESDFRHIAGHGQHVEGWTYGLVKGTIA